MANKFFTEEEFLTEFVKFWENVEKCGISEFLNMEDLKEKLRYASGALTEDTGSAYPGGLLAYINLFVAIAKKIAKMVSGTFNINEESLIKICVLQHLSKIEMFVENDSEWHKKNLGQNYKFAVLDGKLRFGARSALFALNSGIKLTPQEMEAIMVLDNENEDKGAKNFYCIYSTIVRQANELTMAIIKERKNKE